MAVKDKPTDGSGDTMDDTPVPAAIVASSSSIPSESTLLTPVQTYFADEKNSHSGK